MLNQYHFLVILCLDVVEVVFLKYLIIQEWQGYDEIPIPEMHVYFNCSHLSSAVQPYIKYCLLPDSYF